MSWRCFHCNEVFYRRSSAREHFGETLLHEPACQIDIDKYREMQKRFQRSQDEDTDLHRQIAAMESQHRAERRAAEERGYAQGLGDGRALAAEQLRMSTI